MIWEELKDSCLVVLRPKACAEDRDKEKEKGGKGGKWEWREEKTEEEDQLSVAKKNEEVEKPELHRGVDWDSLQLRRHPRRLVGPTGSLRSPTQALTRTSVPLTLASFTILSAGATGRNFFLLGCSSSEKNTTQAPFWLRIRFHPLPSQTWTSSPPRPTPGNDLIFS